MATIKSFTDLKQSKRLAEILPPESADMFYADGERLAVWNNREVGLDISDVPAWSLSALLDVLPTGKVLLHDKWNHRYKCICKNIDSDFYDNPIDACVDMILKLHELKSL